ncbi:oligosaccharide flippase family protein [bacterium]|nr:oligosaccharide flippase family protein [bacterium]
MKNFKNKFIASLASSYIIQFSITGISFVSQMVIARVLANSDFGLFAMATFANLILANIVNLGFGKHLIRTDYEKWGNAILLQVIAMGAIVALFQVYPQVISFYSGDIVVIMKIYSLNLIFLTISSIFNTYLLKELKIQKMIIPQIISTIIYVISVIYLGFHHYGVWAIIYATMISEIFKSLYLSVVCGKELFSRFKFTFEYSFELLNGAFYLFLILLVGNFYNQIHNALLGKFLTPAFVGMFYLAYRFVLLPEKIISKAFRQVLYPAYAENVNNKERVQKIIKFSTLTVVAIEVFIYVLMFIYADLIIKIAYGSKHLDIVPLFRFICFLPIIFPFGKFSEALIISHRYEKWGFWGLLFVIAVSILLGSVLIPIYKNYGMGLVKYIIAFISLLPIIITVFKIKIKLFYKEYFLVYLPLLALFATIFDLKVRLYLLFFIGIYFLVIFYFEYKYIFNRYISLRKLVRKRQAKK